jgi:arylsulfatase A-like enzyme
MTTASQASRVAAPYGRTVGAILTFVLIGLFVKYADLLLTFELRGRFDPPTLANRASQAWMALRFSWQEFALAAVLLAIIAIWQRRVPAPGRRTRVILGSLRAALGLGAIVSVLGIKYYEMYHGHMTITDFENIGWALEIAASVNLFESALVPAGMAACALLVFGLSWLFARPAPHRIRQLTAGALALTAATAVTAWAAGRPQLSEARLEPHPLLWFFAGPLVTFRDLPPIEELAPIGTQHRKYVATVRPRNLILVVLESTPAEALTGYNPDAAGGRRLFTDFADDITLFEQVFAATPESVGSLLSVLTGRAAVPDNASAWAVAAGRPTLADALKTRGFRTEFLLTGPSSAILDSLVGRSFDRAWNMDSPWPRKAEHARLAWGYDDRMMFDEAAAFLNAQTRDTPPFLLVLYTNIPHYPYQSGLIPGLGDDPDARVRHARLVGYVMELLTDLYASMKASGLADSTAVLAYGDHGQAFGEHEGNYVHAKELYTENVHVPVLLLHPRRLGLPSRIGQLGSLDDLMPTALDLLGIAAPPGSGMSLLSEAHDRLLFQMTTFGPGLVGFRDRRFFYVLSRTGRELLFDTIADPHERINVLDQHPDIVNAFRARLKTGAPPATAGAGR